MPAKPQTEPDLQIEDSMPQNLVAGIDEAGRGPWAGPVCAAAVILNRDSIPDGLNDSKKLSEKRREVLFDMITQSAIVGVGFASVAEIDEINILSATYLAMERAVAALDPQPEAVIIDGNRAPQGLPMPSQTIVKGDARSLSIAAASIIAKVSRDRVMKKLAEEFPAYGWHKNKGYGTAAHRVSLLSHGVTPHHRRSFRPVHNML